MMKRKSDKLGQVMSLELEISKITMLGCSSCLLKATLAGTDHISDSAVNSQATLWVTCGPDVDMGKCASLVPLHIIKSHLLKAPFMRLLIPLHNRSRTSVDPQLMGLINMISMDGKKLNVMAQINMGASICYNKVHCG